MVYASNNEIYLFFIGSVLLQYGFVKFAIGSLSNLHHSKTFVTLKNLQKILSNIFLA